MNNRGHRFGRRSLVIVFILGSLAGIAANRWLLPKPSSGGGNGPLAALAEPAAESVLDKRKVLLVNPHLVVAADRNIRYAKIQPSLLRRLAMQGRRLYLLAATTLVDFG